MFKYNSNSFNQIHLETLTTACDNNTHEIGFGDVIEIYHISNNFKQQIANQVNRINQKHENPILSENSINKSYKETLKIIKDEHMQNQGLDEGESFRVNSEIILETIYKKRGKYKQILLNDLYRYIKDILEDLGINNRYELIAKGPWWFRRKQFDDIGKGSAFAYLILNRSEQNITVELLEEMADILYGKEKKDEKKRYIKTKLRELNIFNWMDLINSESRRFRNYDFGVLGKGTGFASMCLGYTVSRLTKRTMLKIANYVYEN